MFAHFLHQVSQLHRLAVQMNLVFIGPREDKQVFQHFGHIVDLFEIAGNHFLVLFWITRFTQYQFVLPFQNCQRGSQLMRSVTTELAHLGK